MTQLHFDLREKQRANCKVCGLLGKCVSEMTTKVDNYSLMRKCQVGVNVSGRNNIKDESRPRLPISTTSKKTSAL
jgi:transcription elongation factor Elf1